MFGLNCMRIIHRLVTTITLVRESQELLNKLGTYRTRSIRTFCKPESEQVGLWCVVVSWFDLKHICSVQEIRGDSRFVGTSLTYLCNRVTNLN